MNHSKPANSVTYRLRGIPAAYGEEGVERLVYKTILRQNAKCTFSVRSLALDPFRHDLKMATLDFPQLPELPAGKSNTEWHFKGDGGVSVVLDSHFIGLTTLYTPSERQWTIDMIAVAGLNGHAFGSFKQRGGSFMWLRDALPRDISGARVMIYGYDTALINSTSTQNISDVGRGLRQSILDVRNGINKRLILLGHSLGGIVIKSAIVEMENRGTAQDKSTLASICCMLFFGVPHQGMEIESMVWMVGNNPNRGFVESLRVHSEFLHGQSDDFSHIIETSLAKCNILNFYETEKSPTAQWNKAKAKWEMTGKRAVLVTPQSATDGRLHNRGLHQVDPINCPHSELVKFNSPYDGLYSTLVVRIQRLCGC